MHLLTLRAGKKQHTTQEKLTWSTHLNQLLFCQLPHWKTTPRILWSLTVDACFKPWVRLVIRNFPNLQGNEHLAGNCTCTHKSISQPTKLLQRLYWREKTQKNSSWEYLQKYKDRWISVLSHLSPKVHLSGKTQPSPSCQMRRDYSKWLAAIPNATLLFQHRHSIKAK